MKVVLALALVVVSFLAVSINAQSDAALRSVIEKDRASVARNGRMPLLPASEHLARGATYFENRQFPEARVHFYKILENHKQDPAMSAALFMTGRSYYWERQYAKGIPYLERAAKEFPGTKDGREGLYFQGSCNVRIERNEEAARVYEQYTVMYPTGERTDGAYLNIIDALREARKYDDADAWVEKVRQKFAGTTTETNALHARLRINIFRGHWNEAVATADTMLSGSRFSGSMASIDEVKYLRAFALERSGKRGDAAVAYSAIPDTRTSYFGGLAADERDSGGSRVRKIAQISPRDFPVMFRDDVLRESKKRGIDPRFVLAIMKQESSFRPAVKSPSAARGLLQLVYDTALKYNKKAGFSSIDADDLYKPSINIAIGCEYIADLKGQFGGLYEAIAASYNGGEDNAARWLKRSNPKEPAIFASEVGFSETKHYVFKVMSNFRIYKELYDEDLGRKSSE
ncbi:MAG: transglycosylase SLT domain-containing protein [Pyrinomonadaceae bacterium]